MYRKRKRKESVDVCIFDAPELSFCALQKAYSENPLKAHERQEPIQKDTASTPAIPGLASPSPPSLPPIGASQPLTQSNLRRLERSLTASDMGGEGSGRKSASSKRKRTDSTSHVDYPDGSSQAAKASPQEIRDTLEHHNFLIDDSFSRKDHPEMIVGATKVIDGRRPSAIGPEELEELISTLINEEFANEDTFIDLLWWRILGESRMVPSVELPREALGDDQWTSRSWREDFLLHNRNRQFRIGCLLPLATENESVKQLIASLPRLSIPKPDLAWGVTKFAFTKAEHNINETYPMFTHPSSKRYHVFLVVEFKSDDGSLGAAKNQASRTAGALMHGLRCLQDCSPHKAVVKGVDDRSWMYSLALDTHGAELFVNWVYVEDDGTPVYHMHSIAGYTMKDGSHLANLNKHIANIMEWGIGERLNRIKETLCAIDAANRMNETN